MLEFLKLVDEGKGRMVVAPGQRIRCEFVVEGLESRPMQVCILFNEDDIKREPITSLQDVLVQSVYDGITVTMVSAELDDDE